MVGCARMHISSDVLDWQVFQCGVAALDGAALRPPFFFLFLEPLSKYVLFLKQMNGTKIKVSKMYCPS